MTVLSEPIKRVLRASKLRASSRQEEFGYSIVLKVRTSENLRSNLTKLTPKKRGNFAPKKASVARLTLDY